MLLIQSKNTFNHYALMDENTGELNFHSKSEPTDIDVSISVINGYYETVNGNLCILYKNNQELYLKIDENEFHITDEIESDFIKNENKHIFELNRFGEILYRTSYAAPKLEVPLEINPTPFIEYEDFDFLFFVHKVINDKGRKERVFNR